MGWEVVGGGAVDLKLLTFVVKSFLKQHVLITIMCTNMISNCAKKRQFKCLFTTTKMKTPSSGARLISISLKCQQILRRSVWFGFYFVLFPNFFFLMFICPSWRIFPSSTLSERLDSSCSQVPFKIGVLKIFTIFTGIHLCWILFLKKLQASLQLY